MSEFPLRHDDPGRDAEAAERRRFPFRHTPAHNVEAVEREQPPPPESPVREVETPPERELFVRHATRDGNSVVRLRAVARDGSCVVEAEVFPPGSLLAVHRGPYTFEDAGKATAFVNEAVESLLYLGCDVFTHY